MVSVDYILQLWQRRGAPLRHFNREFESIILGQTLLASPEVPTRTNSPPRPTVPGVTDPSNTLGLDLRTPGDLAQSRPGRSRPKLSAPGGTDPIRVTSSSVDTIPPFVPRRQTSGLHQRLRYLW
jgi:hypothetical protein